MPMPSDLQRWTRTPRDPRSAVEYATAGAAFCRRGGVDPPLRWRRSTSRRRGWSALSSCSRGWPARPWRRAREGSAPRVSSSVWRPTPDSSASTSLSRTAALPFLPAHDEGHDEHLPVAGAAGNGVPIFPRSRIEPVGVLDMACLLAELASARDARRLCSRKRAQAHDQRLDGARAHGRRRQSRRRARVNAEPGVDTERRTPQVRLRPILITLGVIVLVLLEPALRRGADARLLRLHEPRPSVRATRCSSRRSARTPANPSRVTSWSSAVPQAVT